MSRRPIFVLALFGALLCGCAGPLPAPAPAAPARLQPVPVEAKGLHNVYRLSDALYSGSSPEGDEGFRSLQKLGVQTVLSVDGARPDVERARKHGLRYVHLPIGYDGVPERQAWQIARAVRDLPGPVYLHCHHGKHRGPAAAAAACLCLDESCGVDEALEIMRRAGTDPRYKGLFGSVKSLRRPTAGKLAQAPARFPEVAEVGGLARNMVAVDERWEHLKQVRAAGWKVPPDHPDVDPPHEALQLAEHYREASRLVEVRRRHEELRRWLAEAEEGARALEVALRRTKNATGAERAFRQAQQSCARCHAKYRDAPR